MPASKKVKRSSTNKYLVESRASVKVHYATLLALVILTLTSFSLAIFLSDVMIGRGLGYFAWIEEHGEFYKTNLALQPVAVLASGTSCLTQAGPLITFSGTQTSDYHNTNLATSTKADAATASWTGTISNPVNIGGGSGLCWSGGKLQGTWDPLTTSWAFYHGDVDGTGKKAFKATNALVPNIEKLWIDNSGDGIALYESTENFSIRGAYLHDLHDDCIEGDWLPGGLIDDSFLDGCYVVFGFRPRSSDVTSDGRNKTITIQNTLAWLRDQNGVYNPESNISPGHGMFFKWPTSNDPIGPDRGLKLSITNSIFRVDSTVSFSSHQFEIPADSGGNSKLVDCSNNTIVWYGSGPIPQELLDWPSCFTKTSDRAVWDNAAAAWKTSHGYGGAGSSGGSSGGRPRNYIVPEIDDTMY